MDIHPWVLVCIVLIPFAATGLVLLFRNRPDAREAASLAASLLTFLLCALSLPSAFALQPLSTAALQILPGLDIRFTADALGLLFATLASLLWIITPYTISATCGGCGSIPRPGIMQHLPSPSGR